MTSGLRPFIHHTPTSTSTKNAVHRACHSLTHTFALKRQVMWGKSLRDFRPHCAAETSVCSDPELFLTSELNSCFYVFSFYPAARETKFEEMTSIALFILPPIDGGEKITWGESISCKVSVDSRLPASSQAGGWTELRIHLRSHIQHHLLKYVEKQHSPSRFSDRGENIAVCPSQIRAKLSAIYLILHFQRKLHCHRKSESPHKNLPYSVPYLVSPFPVKSAKSLP